MDLFNNTNPTLMPGQRLLKVKGGYEAAERYPIPRDCEAAIFDDEEDYLYVKKTDTNGGTLVLRYRLEEDPIPKFDPKKYVTIDDFAKFKEDILNGFNDLQQTLSNRDGSSYNRYNKQSDGSNKQSGKSNNGVSQSTASI